jgi:hypothetical protein
VVKHISSISGILERIEMAIQVTSVIRVVCHTWQHTEIVPTISTGAWTICVLCPEHVLLGESLSTGVGAVSPIWEGGSGISMGHFGFLKEEMMLLWVTAQCPFCFRPLSLRK